MNVQRSLLARQSTFTETLSTQSQSRRERVEMGRASKEGVGQEGTSIKRARAKHFRPEAAGARTGPNLLMAYRRSVADASPLETTRSERLVGRHW